MNIEIRLRSLEAKRAAQKGVFVIMESEDGYITINGEKRIEYNSIDDAVESLEARYNNPAIISWRRSETEEIEI